MNNDTITISEAAEGYLTTIQSARSVNTYRTYGNAIRLFLHVLEKHGIPLTAPASTIPDDSISWTITILHPYSVATERLYLTAISGFFEYLYSEQLASPNLPRISGLIARRARRIAPRLPQFPHNYIEQLIHHARNIAVVKSKDKADRLRNFRDKALLLVLADTGLRIHEACGLDRGSIDWEEARAVVVIKGGRESVVRFSERSLVALRRYLVERASLDGASGKPLASLPLFARHDKGAGKKVLRITPTTGRSIINQQVAEVLGPEAVGTITPHSFRHYFVTVVLRSSGNLKLAQELARHKNIAVTQRYAHLSDDELDRGYHGIFNRGEPNAPTDDTDPPEI